jgi:hypothetical protein
MAKISTIIISHESVKKKKKKLFQIPGFGKQRKFNSRFTAAHHTFFTKRKTLIFNHNILCRNQRFSAELILHFRLVQPVAEYHLL